MKKIDQLKKKEKEQLKVLHLIQDEIELVQSKTKVECKDNFQYGSGCGCLQEIRKLEYIQTHWYETPSGCMGGDCWHQSEGQFICLKCFHTNRLYDRKEIQELKHLFKSIKEVHER